MRSYDLVYIVKPDLDSEAITAVVERVTQRLKEQGVAIEHAEAWGKRRMAYPIKRYREGHYVFMRFAAPGDRIPEIRHNLRILEDILRASVTVAAGPIAPPKTAQPSAAPAGAPVGAPVGVHPAEPAGAPVAPPVPQSEVPSSEAPQA